MDLAEESKSIAEKIGISRTELIRQALRHELDESAPKLNPSVTFSVGPANGYNCAKCWLIASPHKGCFGDTEKFRKLFNMLNGHFSVAVQYF